MMGHSYYGSKLSDQHRYERKFAWWPVISGSKKRVWLTHYYIRYTFYDNNVSLLYTDLRGITSIQRMNTYWNY